MFLGTVGKKVADDIYSLDIRNQIKKDGLEFIGPDVPLLTGDVALLDGDMNETGQLDHGKPGFIRTSLPLKEGYIMRRLTEGSPIIK